LRAVRHYDFSLGPSTPDHDRALRALDGLDGFASALEANGRFRVDVEAASFDAAQYKLRDALAELDEGVPISLPIIGDRRAGPEGG
jgi:hypothetical protein